jgi:FixJ family two-component response regulator
MNQPTVYIVDDDNDLRASLECLLRTSGYKTRSFSSAGDFLKVHSAEMSGCVIVDQQMPGLTGVDLLEQIHGAEVDSLPAIFITAYADVPTAVSAMKSGAIDFLEKPFEREELLSKIETALSQDLERQSLRKQRENLIRKFNRLSDREKATLEMLRQGLPNKAIAARLQITERAVEMRRARIMEKLEARSIADLYEDYAEFRLLTTSQNARRVDRN